MLRGLGECRLQGASGTTEFKLNPNIRNADNRIYTSLSLNKLAIGLLLLNLVGAIAQHFSDSKTFFDACAFHLATKQKGNPSRAGCPLAASGRCIATPLFAGSLIVQNTI